MATVGEALGAPRHLSKQAKRALLFTAVLAAGGGGTAVVSAAGSGSGTIETTVGNVPTPTEAPRVLENLEVPDSNDPQTLADQLAYNLESYINTGDERYLEFVFADTDGHDGQLAQGFAAQVGKYRKEQDPNYRRQFAVAVTDSEGFGDGGAKKIKMILSQAHVFGDGETRTLADSTMTWDLTGAQRTVPGTNQTVSVLLIENQTPDPNPSA